MFGLMPSDWFGGNEHEMRRCSEKMKAVRVKLKFLRASNASQEMIEASERELDSLIREMSDFR